MGRSEWGVLCRSKAEARRILQAVQEHNSYNGEDDEVGEWLTCGCLLRFHGLPFLCLQNGGGRTLTNRWLWDRLSDIPIFWALSKPPGWNECQDFMWQAGDDEAAQPENIDVEALPLPDTTPPGPLPPVPELGDWLMPCKPVTDIGAELFGVPGATGFFVSFDPVTGERTERVLKRGEQPPFPFAFW